MTSAPRSANIIVQNGPETTKLRSRTRIPLSGPIVHPLIAKADQERQGSAEPRGNSLSRGRSRTGRGLPSDLLSNRSADEGQISFAPSSPAPLLADVVQDRSRQSVL